MANAKKGSKFDAFLTAKKAPNIGENNHAAAAGAGSAAPRTKLAKSKDENYKQTNLYLLKETVNDANYYLGKGDPRDLSELAQDLLAAWVQERKAHETASK